MSTRPLALALAAAVPLEILRMRALGPAERDRLIAARTGRAVAQLLGGPRCGEDLAAPAEGVACLAWAPGGVDVLGMHFCTDHAACLAAEAEVGA